MAASIGGNLEDVLNVTMFPHILDITLYVSVISHLSQRDMITGDVHILGQLYLVKSPPCPTIAHIGSSGVNYAQMKLRGA